MNLLVAVDFTDLTNPLLQLAKSIASLHSGKVYLLHAVEPILLFPLPESFSISTIDFQLVAEAQEKSKKLAEEKLKGLVNYLSPLEVQTIVEVGDPVEVILQKEDMADLVLMGSHKKGLIERVLIGSTAEKVARYSKKPVLILKGKLVESFRKVLIAFDYSSYSEKALEFAVKLLRPMKPEIILLHVKETLEIPLVEHIKSSVSEVYEREKEVYLRNRVESLQAEGITASYKFVETGLYLSVWEAIVNQAKEEDVDLIVLGSKGMSALERVLLGSVSEKVLRRSEIPILIHRETA
ncbi:universal stress protein [Thermocrinis minervae]|uniref:Nucleotide-binding universal stress protein, UspA family n=1 Tax=Thermocrinis minervae TaxID=381751 RepID=A0A1M6QX07_9AQUI|nr:universal stress protein [Thermocrinis minervae]SHK24735.1 Nucleotide-binding universal stress protein, UspA family [Thermocrinis minervae]